jgi:hypothetical protein
MATLTRDATSGLRVDGVTLSQPFPTADPVILHVDCSAQVDCTKLSVATQVDGAEKKNWTAVSAATATGASFSAPRSSFSAQATGNTLVVQVGTEPALKVVLGRSGSADMNETLRALVGNDPLLPCTEDILAAARDSGYTAWEVTPVGRVLRQSAPEIHEGDRLAVYIRGPEPLVSRMWAVRTSAFRTVGSFDVVGADASLSRDFFHESSEGDAECRLARSMVENFAGGEKGEVSLMLAVAASGAAKDTFGTRTTGKVELPVHRLYRGALSMGLARTQLESPSFTVAARDSTVVAAESGPRYLYTLFFTPYIWKRRDVEHWRIEELPTYLNPTVGVVINDLAKNALGGATLELPGGIFLSGGYHAGKVTRLVPGGPAVGTVVHGSAAHLETEQRWRVQPFYSLSIDLRAAALLFGRLAGTATGAR